MNKLKRLYKTIQSYGFRPLAFRLKYELSLKTGLLKSRFPQYQWSQRPLSYWLKEGVLSLDKNYRSYRQSLSKPCFFFSADEFKNLEFSQKEKMIQQADEILRGRLSWFSKLSADVGAVPNWHQNPFTSQFSPPDKHWLDLRDFAADQGDIKFIWEPSRFGWIFTLVRAYAATGDQKYSEHFWCWLENWMQNNPPNTGANYKCGQECAIRCVAVCFAFYAFMGPEQTTPQRLEKLVCMLASHAERIEKNIGYAQYQNNNHAISEALGLFMVGLLFPELKRSAKWRQLGIEVLEETASKQIFEDGAYIQHSMNYHRLALSEYLLALRLAELNGIDFSKQFKDKVQRSFEFLYQMQDADSGRVPNYGSNDGALFFSLDSCDYLDYRPVLGALNVLLSQTKIYPDGPWDELLQWLFGHQSNCIERKDKEQKSVAFTSGGYYTLRQKDSWTMTRCHTYKTRPGHADMLHVDLWAHGKNILRDSGTYSYNTEQPWQNYFSSTTAHNCPVIDGKDQMTRGTRFMWFDWLQSKVIVSQSNQEKGVHLFQGRHFGFIRNGMNVIHQRSILAAEQLGWLIIDDILGKGTHELMMPWQLCTGSWKIENNAVILPDVASIQVYSDQTVLQYTLQQGNQSLPAGWTSEYYGTKEPAPVFMTHGTCDLPVRLFTQVSLPSNRTTFHQDENKLTWLDDKSIVIAQAEIEKISRNETPVLKELIISGQSVDVF